MPYNTKDSLVQSGTQPPHQKGGTTLIHAVWSHRLFTTADPKPHRPHKGTHAHPTRATTAAQL